jgi:hypothetical protein
MKNWKQSGVHPKVLVKVRNRNVTDAGAVCEQKILRGQRSGGLWF